MKARQQLLAIAAAFSAVWFLASAASAQAAPSITVSWTHPTTRVNGAALAVSEIASTRVEYSTCTGSALTLPIIGTVTVPAPATTSPAITTGITSGTYCAQAKTVLNDGQISAASNVGVKVIPISPPNPPTLTTITATAWLIKDTWWGGQRLVRLWNYQLPIGTPCGAVWNEARRQYIVYGAVVGRCS